MYPHYLRAPRTLITLTHISPSRFSYPTSSVLQLKRTNARRVGSTYAPDFLGLMEVALINSWQVHSHSQSQSVT